MERKFSPTPLQNTQTNRKVGQQHNSTFHEHKFNQSGQPVQAKPSVHETINPSTSNKIHGFLTRPVNPLPLFFIFVLLKVLASELHSSANSIISINNLRKSISQAVYSPETVNMLETISPYLDVPEQEGIYTIIGVLEALQILKGLREGSYQAQRMHQLPVLKLENENKSLEIIKALKNYMSETNRPTIERALQLHESIEKLSNNIKIYRNNLKIAGKHKPNPIEDLSEIIKVIKPIIPEEQQNKLEKLHKLIQVAQIMDLDDMLKKRQADTSLMDEGIKEDDKNQTKRYHDFEKDSGMANTNSRYKNNSQYLEREGAYSSDASQGQSTDDQAQTIELLLRLMQLFKQNSPPEQKQ